MGAGVITARFPEAQAAVRRSGSGVRREDQARGIPQGMIQRTSPPAAAQEYASCGVRSPTGRSGTV